MNIVFEQLYSFVEMIMAIFAGYILRDIVVSYKISHGKCGKHAKYPRKG